jgi:transposase-like protein
MKYTEHKSDIQKIKKVLIEYEQSNKSLKELSEKYGIPNATLKYYRRKMTKGKESTKQRGGSREHITVEVVKNSTEEPILSEMEQYKQKAPQQPEMCHGGKRVYSEIKLVPSDTKTEQPKSQSIKANVPMMTTKHGHNLVDLEAYAQQVRKNLQ